MKEKQQIIHIHGGMAFNSYEEYINILKNIDLYHMQENEKSKSWYKRYDDFLSKDSYENIYIPMPSKDNAKYSEWKIWFERHIPFLRADVILVGHSLGGIFLAKWLSENVLLINIKQIHLVSAVYDYEDDIEQLGDFRLNEFPKNFFQNNIREIHIYHSIDDDIVPISESEKYHEKLPNSELHIFHDRGHFLNDTFPELFEIIKNA